MHITAAIPLLGIYAKEIGLTSQNYKKHDASDRLFIS